MKTQSQLRYETNFKTATGGNGNTSRVRIHGFIVALVVALNVSADTLVPAGSVWKYRDDGSDQGTAWREPTFYDATWLSGRAHLGYGDGDEATVVSFGTNANDKFITTYFRLAFAVADFTAFTNLTFSLLRDDGAVVYLNGREVFRDNMPAGIISYRTLASTNVSGAGETTFYQTSVAATNLVNGVNVLAVEIHQNNNTSTDISFDLALVGNRPPLTIALVSPTDGATQVNTAPVLNVSLPNNRSGNYTVTFLGRPAGPPPGPDFTLIALPDTQYYVASLNGGRPSNLTAQADWIVANKAARNIAFVTQLGDLSEHGDNNGINTEWLNATNALYRLENPVSTLLTDGIPYGVAVGNHDLFPKDDPNGTTTFYNQFFGETHFAGKSYYGGHYGTNNDNHFELFSVSGLNFIAIHLEYNPNTNILNWANSLLQSYPDRRAIVINHYLLETGNPANFGGAGQAVYNALKNNANLFLMLCGHVPGEGRRQDLFNNNTVYTLLSDYQSWANGGNSFLRIMEFSPSNNVICVKTYSPTLDQYTNTASSQFTLNYNMRQGGSFTTLGSISNLAAPANLTLAWPGLAYATAYEWYVTVSDGANIVSSPVWRFTTASNTPPTVTVSRVAEAPVSGFVPSVTLAIDAEATDADGVITKVEFYQGNNKLGEDTNSPFTCTWNNVPIGVYAITAIAQDSGGLRTTSAPVTITVALPEDPAAKAVASPGDLTAIAESSNQILLQWTDNADNETGFMLERSIDGANFVRVTLLAANVQSYTDSGLQAETSYTYRVRAFNASKLSDFSSLASAATPPASTPALRIALTYDRTNNTMTVSWPSTPGYVYRVVAKETITDPGWIDLSADISAGASTTSWSEALSAFTPVRFYAVRIIQ